MHEHTLSVSAAGDRATAGARDFLDLLFPPPREFAIRLWDGTLLPAHRDPVFTLVVRAPGSLRRMLRPPVELSLGEAYLRRDFDIEGELDQALELVPAARASLREPARVLALAARWPALPHVPPLMAAGLAGRAPARLSGGLHSRQRDRQAVRFHYDVGNEFYQLFLDRRMIYSCAYFPTGHEDLDAAQEAKLELVCRKLRLRPGEHLLDVGCGWGGLLIYAAERHGVTGLGITLSEEQHRLARQRVEEAGLRGRVRVEQLDYRELGDRSFDKIVSVGMFEHVGRDQLPRYFAEAFRLLAPGGLFLNHGISNRPERRPRGPAAWLERALVGNYAFRRRYIFPDGELVPLSEVNLLAERAGFEVRDVENLREHYVLTLQHWLGRLRGNRREAARMVGDPFFRLWELYLAACVHHFRTGRISVNQTLLAKLRNGATPLPLTRADLYA